MNISILTSRYGPTNKQLERFENFIAHDLSAADDTILHGGDKGDELIHDKLMLHKFTVEIYPIKNSEAIEVFKGNKIHGELRLDDRFRKLVELSEMIIGLPQYMNAWEDSVFWKTARYAVAIGKQVNMISSEGYCWNFRR